MWQLELPLFSQADFPQDAVPNINWEEWEAQKLVLIFKAEQRQKAQEQRIIERARRLLFLENVSGGGRKPLPGLAPGCTVRVTTLTDCGEEIVHNIN